jgi:hypothetical protein
MVLKGSPVSSVGAGIDDRSLHPQPIAPELGDPLPWWFAKLLLKLVFQAQSNAARVVERPARDDSVPLQTRSCSRVGLADPNPPRVAG